MVDNKNQTVYRCYLHEFETVDINEWLDHKVDVVHYDSGVGRCEYCGKQVRFNNVVQKDKRKSVEVVCPNCADKRGVVSNSQLTGKIVRG